MRYKLNNDMYLTESSDSPDVTRIFVFQKDKFTKKRHFLVIRDSDKGTWDFPGGHVEEGEAVPDCAIREIKEECGININKKNLKYLFKKPTVQKDGSVYFFVALYKKEKPVNIAIPNPENNVIEHLEFRWIKDIKELDFLKFTYNDSKECLKKLMSSF